MRTDIHSESHFIAADYTPVGYYYAGTPEFNIVGPNANGQYLQTPNPEWANMSAMVALVKASTTTAYASGIQCDHCGASIKYVVVMLHKPTGDHLAVGETCAAGRFTYSEAKFAQMRRNAAEARKAAKRVSAWSDFMTDHANVDWLTLHASTNSFVMDVLRKGRAYGELSDRQLNAIQVAVVRDAQHEVEKAERDAADALKVRTPAPSGRVTVTGTVLTTKVVYGDFGSTVKMLVESNEGFKVWVSMPSSLDVDRDDVVRFDAELTQSKDDIYFAWGKRPTKAQVLKATNA